MTIMKMIVVMMMMMMMILYTGDVSIPPVYNTTDDDDDSSDDDGGVTTTTTEFKHGILSITLFWWPISNIRLCKGNIHLQSHILIVLLGNITVDMFVLQ